MATETGWIPKKEGANKKRKRKIENQKVNRNEVRILFSGSDAWTLHSTRTGHRVLIIVQKLGLRYLPYLIAVM